MRIVLFFCNWYIKRTILLLFFLIRIGCPMEKGRLSRESFLTQHRELINLIGTFTHIPYIVYAGDADYKTVQRCSVLAMVDTVIKLIDGTVLSEWPGIPKIKTIVIDGTKDLGYLLGLAYHIIRWQDAVQVACRNANDNPSKLRGFKINQGMQLALEIIFRFIAWSVRMENPTSSYIASEFADAVKIWRFLCMYTTYFAYTEKLALNITIQREQLYDNNDTENAAAIAEQNDLGVLESFAEELAKKATLPIQQMINTECVVEENK